MERHSSIWGMSDRVQKQPPEVFCKKGVLRNLAKFTGKHLCQSLFFNKVAGVAKFLRKPFSQNTSGRLLLRVKYPWWNIMRIKLKFTSHAILHYFWSACLSKKFFTIDYVNIYLFSRFLSIDFSSGKMWGYPTLLISWFIKFNN